MKNLFYTFGIFQREQNILLGIQALEMLMLAIVDDL